MRRLSAGLLLGALAAATLQAEPRPGIADLLGPRAGLIVVADLRSGRVLDRVDRRTRPGAVPVGSLLKPFLLLAWEDAHPERTPPRAYCTAGGPPGCWYRPGHGVVDLERALSVSCNEYFRRLSREVDAPGFGRALRTFGLVPRRGPGGEGSDPVEARLGRGSSMRFPPQRMLEAYGALWTGARFRLDPGHPAYRGAVTLGARPRRWLERGLAASAREGTAAGAGRALRGAEVLAKTGTTARLGEGGAALPAGTAAWFVGAAPASRPELGVLVYLEEGTGSADAAPLGGRLLERAWRARRGAPPLRTSRRR
jgi:cell division protein FtsI/penicillin-binding protein 2